MDTTQPAQTALGGLRVLDLTGELGALSTKLLADMGADVIKVEPPEGDPTRRLGPFVTPVEGPDRSLNFMHFNTNKRSLTLDLNRDPGRDALKRLAASASLVVESQPPGYLDSIGLGFDPLREANPALVMTSVSGFGQTGPYSQFKAPDLVCLAMGGLLYITGQPETPPVRAHGNQSYQIASIYAALGSMCALQHSHATGQGQHVDISAQASTATYTRLVGSYLADGTVHSRQGSRDFFVYPSETFQCKDGWGIITCVSPQEWPLLVSWMASEGMAGDLINEVYADNQYRLDNCDHVRDLIAAWAATHTTDEIFEGGQQRNLAFGKVFEVADALENPHLRARGFFVDVEHPELATTLTYPGAPYIFSETPWTLRRPAPQLGEHNQELLAGELGLSESELQAATGHPKTIPAASATTSAPPSAPASPPNNGSSTTTRDSGPRPLTPGALAGVTVADFTWVWAGPLSTRMLSDFGANVIKIENPESRRLALARRETFGINAVGLMMLGSLNRNKQSVTANLKDPRGMEIARRIIEKSDIVVDNFSAGTMSRLGLGYEQLKEIKPDIIALSLSGFGHSGPWTKFRSYGPTLQAISGLIDLTGYPESAGSGVGEAYPDPTGGLHGTLSALMALEYRRRTGKGQFIDVGQLQTASAMLGTAVLDYSANGHVQRRLGNQISDRSAAPHGVYPCLGQDNWCVIGAFAEDEWTALRKAIGDPSWATDPTFATIAARAEECQYLDRLLAEWTSQHTAQEIMEKLQAAGVPAAVVQDSSDLYENDLQLRHRGYWLEMDHDELGTLTVDGVVPTLSETPAQIRRFAPLPGDDSDSVLDQLLGISQDRIDEYREAGVV